MDGFSTSSLTSLCSTIHNRAISTVAELNELVESLGAVGQHAQKLLALSAALQQFGQYTTTLEKSLNASQAMSGRLRSLLAESLTACDGTTGKLSKQIKRLQPQTAGEVDWSVIALYNEFSAVHTRLLMYFNSLLKMNDMAKQDDAIDETDAQQILEQAKASRSSVSANYDLFSAPLSAGKEQSGPVGASRPVHGEFPDEKAQPPPYESGSRPQSGEEAQISNTGGAFGSLKQSFKAFTTALLPKPDPLVTALCQASSRGEVQQISGLIAQGVNVNGRNEDGITPLQCAIRANLPQATQLLLDSGAKSESLGSNKIPALFYAASVGSVEVAKALFRNQAQVHERSIIGQLYFVDVVESENLDGVRFLLENGADPQARFTSGRHVIVHAVRRRNMRLVELLVQHGASIHCRDITGESLLGLANDRDPSIASMLLQRGADPNASKLCEPILADVLAKGNLTLGRELLLRGADPEAKDVNSQTVLNAAIKNSKINQDDRLEIVRMLLDHGASLEKTDSYHGLPIWNAVAAKNQSVVELLVARGARLSGVYNGETLLLKAITHQQRDQAKLLLENGSDPNEQDDHGRIPLLEAVTRSDRTSTQVLLEYGADPNKIDKHGRIALVEALTRNDKKLTQLLLEYGSNPNLSDKAGRMPLKEALTRHDAILVRLVAEYGADTKATNQFDPMEFANNLKRPDIVDALSSSGRLTPNPRVHESNNAAETTQSSATPPPYEK